MVISAAISAASARLARALTILAEPAAEVSLAAGAMVWLMLESDELITSP
jgi:hypothetical protein